jgi:chromosome segregation ATPase
VDSKDVEEDETKTTFEKTATRSGSARGSLDVPAQATPAVEESRFSFVRPSQDSYKRSMDSTQTLDVAPSMPLQRTPSFLEAEVSRLHTTHEENARNYQEELHAHLERIDALQQKLEYMTKQATATARQHAESAESGSLEKKLAEQEERNALLLEEGNTLSKNEIKQRGAIIKLRQRVQAEEKEKAELKQKLHILEAESSDVKDRLKITEEREKAAQVRLKSLSKLEVELDTAKRERDEARRDITSLKQQLAEAERKAEDAETRAQTGKLEDQMRVVAELNDDLSNARLEKRLVEDRAKAEMKQLREDAVRQQEKSQLAELELRNEIQVYTILTDNL